MKALQIGDLKQVGTCTIATVFGPIEKWPVLLINGVWGLTPRYDWVKKKPDLTWEWLTVAHLPTGRMACDVRVDDPLIAQKLAKIAALLGKSKTVWGVIRKFNALPESQKKWIKEQKSWLLSKERGGAQ
jgi:hypothetical protein